MTPQCQVQNNSQSKYLLKQTLIRNYRSYYGNSPLKKNINNKSDILKIKLNRNDNFKFFRFRFQLEYIFKQMESKNFHEKLTKIIIIIKSQ